MADQYVDQSYLPTTSQLLDIYRGQGGMVSAASGATGPITTDAPTSSFPWALVLGLGVVAFLVLGKRR